MPRIGRDRLGSHAHLLSCTSLGALGLEAIRIISHFPLLLHQLYLLVRLHTGAMEQTSNCQRYYNVLEHV